MRVHARIDSRVNNIYNTFSIGNALQTVLAAGKRVDLHPRYDGSRVGLAVARASVSTVQEKGLSPLDGDSLDRLDSHVFNSDTQPDAWRIPNPQQYYELLGGVPDVRVGRFSAFALAKLNEILATGKTSSHSASKIETGPGRVGLAGGVRTEGQLTSVSGLWEVHDHAVARVIEQTDGTTFEDNAAEEALRAVFHQIKGLHRQSGPADELSRNFIGIMLEEVDEIVSDNLPTTF
jgi:hypothetical protein